ncbi:DEAD/DEAH box helicase family protein [Sabulilitoribacter multivorans]|uniref:DEAD/DEAH box helicase family protein n=1 Tax=Flaviramulus multivorans TaxID=1304750 RepID=A0ABS9IF49_9FLAO|nr:DEAD/DEAH box helicase family protein [Flaviramulus multivorans]MCF7559408.1 DEAD/DEAH box helicase family protein [Flaviramulus multivorans]
MLNKIIRNKTVQWLQSPDCSIKELITYIKNKGELRDTQIEAIETFLFLKIQGKNKPLWNLFSDGFFTNGTDLSKLDINQNSREHLENNKDAFSLFDFARQKVNGKKQLPNLEHQIIKSPEEFDYQEIIKKLFYNVNYSDYLMSLPMGSGKTYLMAAFIYLDLYFASNEPENKNFAHNFLVLIPSGLKTSIGPSLRTIEDFDPSWVIPEPAASNLKKQLKFDVLDEAKSAKKSNKARNPNAQKVNEILPDPFGQVFIVNAEKVILNRVDTIGQTNLFEDEEDKKANELRALIGKIPNLSILIDEVHHAAKSDIKLRQVVNRWNDRGSITTVLGFSGTPYLSTAEKIQLTEDDTLRISEITNTVYYYPLTNAIEDFLKNPTVKITDNLTHLQIVKEGIKDFNKTYDGLTYANGTIPKVAIYCSNIEMLEEEVYPFLQSDLKIHPDEILRFHGGNKIYSLPKENELQFKSLDTTISKKKYILLVAIGKEGWDCKSLTSVILPQKSKSASINAIIQTTCRCLRQVVKGHDETALIWLNRENATILNKALEKEQNTSIEELNNLDKNKGTDLVERHSRMEFLKLPKIDYYQLKVKYQSIEEEEKPNTKIKLEELFKNINDYKANYAITTKGLDFLDEGELSFLNSSGFQLANYNHWIAHIAKDSFSTISAKELHQFNEQLKPIFQAIILNSEGNLFFNEQFDTYKIESKIRVAFSIKRDLTTEEEIIPKEANLLILDKLKSIPKHKNLYPNQEVTKQILQFDKKPQSEQEFEDYKKNKMIELITQGKTDEAVVLGQSKIYSETKQKDKSFHLLPYNFDSGFESQFLNEILKLKDFKENNLEIYFNGERGTTEFVINCFAKKGKRWNKVGKYTTDFLVIKRNSKDAIHKALIIETKGEGYSNDKDFIKKKNFIETDFLKHNEDKFGYKKFDFLYLEDSNRLLENIAEVNQRINQFFKD